MAEETRKIPEREEIAEEHKWDLSSLFKSDEGWRKGLADYEALVSKIESFKGTLGKSAKNLRACLEFMNKLGMLGEQVVHYAQLKLAGDAGDGNNQERLSRAISIATKAEALASYQNPEIQSISDDKMAQFMADPVLADFEISLKKLLRFKPHVLGSAEERVIALQREVGMVAGKTFNALSNVDLDFGTVETKEGERPLSQSSWASFMIEPDRELRKKVYHQFYEVFDQHKNTLTSLYEGSIQLNVYSAKVRNYSSALQASLFPDKVSESVFDNLIKTINEALPALHEYYQLRKKVMGVDDLRHYDVYVPLVQSVDVKNTYEEAVNLIVKAVAVLGEEYCQTLQEGLLGGWVDRYENKGKHSGAFSHGSFSGDPFIMMNYDQNVLRELFTLAHEAGHSMHSWYSARNNPFQNYDYTIFEAEVASTFNEQLLANHLMNSTDSREMQTFLLGKQIDDFIATIFRQTMFSEFEKRTHEMVESGEPLTVDSVRAEYRELLVRYFGPEFELEEMSDLEGLRIPHFYGAYGEGQGFYVYKYATGLAAAIALSKKVLAGKEEERDHYLSFLKSGGSKYPLESLALAGVDLGSPEPINSALEHFRDLLKRFSGMIE